ncbi:hypothetical protein CEF00_13470, partial [Lactobacillus crispatus]
KRIADDGANRGVLKQSPVISDPRCRRQKAQPDHPGQWNEVGCQKDKGGADKHAVLRGPATGRCGRKPGVRQASLQPQWRAHAASSGETADASGKVASPLGRHHSRSASKASETYSPDANSDAALGAVIVKVSLPTAMRIST